MLKHVVRGKSQRSDVSPFLAFSVAGFITFICICLLLLAFGANIVGTEQRCSLKSEEISRELLKEENLYLNESVLILFNFSLPCFPRNAFANLSLNTSAVTNVKFSAMRIEMIEENAFSSDIGFDIEQLCFENCKIGTFYDQKKEFSSV
eukprot:snap_masked-scaffold_11-processed-gene-7.35-mRNA-1 protein AED:1.00 eAED:1.00 QI:0/-1/0/0/-1/1/1/0/148